MPRGVTGNSRRLMSNVTVMSEIELSKILLIPPSIPESRLDLNETYPVIPKGSFVLWYKESDEARYPMRLYRRTESGLWYQNFYSRIGEFSHGCL